MKKKRILIGILLAATVAVTAGCQSKNAKTQEDVSEFSYWCGIPSAALSHINNMNDMLMYQEMEKETGIKINFIHPSGNQSSEQFNLLIASGEYPDMIEYHWRGYPGGPGQAISDGVIVSLNDIMKECTPNFKKLLDSNETYDTQSKTDEGDYYGFPAVNVDEYRRFGGLMLRKDWLDDLGLEPPETIEEWETVLRAFKEKKGAGAPFTATANMLDASNESINLFNTAYDIGKGFYMDGKTVKHIALVPEYKNYLQRMNQWMAEGLIDADFDTNNAQAIDAKMTMGEAGARFGYVGSTIGTYMNTMASKDPSFDLVAVPYPVMKKGDTPKFGEVQAEVSSPMIAITTACKNVEKAAKWADYLYSDKGKYLKNFGVEGKTYNMVDGKPVYTDEILHNPEGLSISEAMAMNFRANEPAPGINQMNEYLDQYYQLDQQKEAIKIWNQGIDEAKKTSIPPLNFTLDENSELSSIMSEVRTYLSENQLKFIKGGKSFDEFDSFIGDLKNMKLERAIEIYQAAADRYFGRK